MNKSTIVRLAIEQLLERFEEEPGSFEIIEEIDGFFGAARGCAVLWIPSNATDPFDTIKNKSGAVIVAWNPKASELACMICHRDTAATMGRTLSSMYSARHEAGIAYTRRFEKFRYNYRKFKQLTNLIKNREINRRNVDFMRKLNFLLPDAIDKDLLGK